MKNIKKIIEFCAVFGTCAVMTACGAETEQTKGITVNNSQTVEDVLSSNTNIENTKVDNDTISATKILSSTTYENVDLDLTTMSSTMVYSEISNLMNDADSYMDKVIKINGYTNIYDDANTGYKYYSCIIPDATSCCAQGIEFFLNDEYASIDDYPLEGETITVIGRLSAYTEGDAYYLALFNAELVEK